MKRFTIIVFSCLLYAVVLAQSGTTGDLSWSIFDSTLTISGTGAMPDYETRGFGEVPPWYVYRNEIVSVIIGDNVSNIGHCAFVGCTRLTSVIIPYSVTSIGNLAFDDCHGLTSIIIPNSITSIGSFAFNGCRSLTSIIIPNSVTYIGKIVFDGCLRLTSINVDTANTAYSSEEGILFDKKKTTLIQYPAGKIGAYTIPNSTRYIEVAAFVGCTGLTSIIIPNSVTSIGDEVFSWCTGLTSVTIGNSVTSIGNRVFWNNISLTSVAIGSSVTSIGGYAFQGCTALTSVIIPNSVSSIEILAFMNCDSLIEIINERAVPQKIDAWVFYNVDIATITLRVPTASVKAYSRAKVWKKFRIEGF